MKRISLFVVFYCLFQILCSPIFAQINTSPYSKQGIGLVSGPALIDNMGMGGLGISNGNGLHINNVNPAMLYKNNLTSFDVAFAGEVNNLSNSEETQQIIRGGLSYVVVAFPVIPLRWTFSVGLMPYSTVGYNITESRPVEGSAEDATAELSATGSGGITQVYVSNGVKVFKNFSLGLKAAFLFGSTIDETSFILDLPPPNYESTFVERLTVSDVVFSPAAHYSLKLGQNTLLNAGVTYQPKTNVTAEGLTSLQRRVPGNDQSISTDTLTEVSGKIILPTQYGFGLSLEKPLKYTVGVDLQLLNWSEFRDFSGSNDNMQDGYKVTVGGELIPDITSVDSYLKRMQYRVGGSYQLYPFMVNNEQISGYSLNFGVSFPVFNFSSLNLAVEYGERGTTQNELIKESYFQIHIGATFNDNTWFVRRKFN